eukprot:53069-Eustigmatos_ZCMA.PRE.1
MHSVVNRCHKTTSRTSGTAWFSGEALFSRGGGDRRRFFAYRADIPAVWSCVHVCLGVCLHADNTMSDASLRSCERYDGCTDS